jgi:arsenate reductase
MKLRVLVVCTGNSARSIMAEVLLRDRGGADLEVHSAGTHPKGINPLTERVLAEAGLSTAGLRSKSVEEFLGQAFDYVITVCDQAREACPVFPGSANTLHWGYDDPAAVEGTDEERMHAFRGVFTQMATRIGQFVTIARRHAGVTMGG